MSFTTSLTAGAFLLATWFDVRFDARRPATPGRRIVHVAVSCVLLQIAGVAGAVLVPEHAAAATQFAVAFALILPALVYTFVSGLWLIRTLAEVAFARR
jgi:hypothetical protein